MHYLDVLCIHRVSYFGAVEVNRFLSVCFSSSLHANVVEKLEIRKMIFYWLHIFHFVDSYSFFSLPFPVPPERISIRDESNAERNSVVGPYSEGDNMKLKCDVFGGRPTPNVTWYRDGIPISSETFLVPSGRNLRSEIVVDRLSRQDLNSRFTCKAINHHRATPVEASVQLDMNCELKNVFSSHTCSAISIVTRDTVEARISAP